MRRMPTYLRWIAALSAGFTVQFAFSMLGGAIAVGTGNTEIDRTTALLLTLASFPITVIPALAVNDWLARRYPRTDQSPSDSR